MDFGNVIAKPLTFKVTLVSRMVLCKDESTLATLRNRLAGGQPPASAAKIAWSVVRRASGGGSVIISPKE